LDELTLLKAAELMPQAAAGNYFLLLLL